MAKYADALRRISLAWRTPLRNLSVVQPILAETERMAAYCVG
jgi:hypothetical protein